MKSKSGNLFVSYQVMDRHIQIFSSLMRNELARHGNTQLSKLSLCITHFLFTVLYVFDHKFYTLLKDVTPHIPQGMPGQMQKFVDHVKRTKGLSYDVDGNENIIGQSPGIIVANHPTGILEGVLIYDFLTEQNINFVGVVLCTLLTIDPQEEFIIPVNKHLKPNEHADLYSAVKEKLEAGYHIVILPGGDMAYYDQESDSFIERDWRRTACLLSTYCNVNIYPLLIDMQYPENMISR